MKIDFSKCSNEDVAELLFACYEQCGWLCHEYHFSCIRCCAGVKNYLCSFHGMGEITKLEIARQCHEEILRRKTPVWIKEIERR